MGAHPGESSFIKAESTPVKGSDNTVQQQQLVLEIKCLELEERRMEIEANVRLRTLEVEVMRMKGGCRMQSPEFDISKLIVRSLGDIGNQTFVEFAHEKERMFNRWCASQGVKQFKELRDLMIMEEFKNCLPECVATYLNEQKETQVAQAVVLADEFSLTHINSSAGKSPLHHNNITHKREFPDGSVGPLKTNTPHFDWKTGGVGKPKESWSCHG